jgi:predicted ATPase with chaperone activity
MNEHWEERLFELTDAQFADLLDAGRKEAARRAAALSVGDSASIIRGNEAAKRALLIAAAGNHSVLLAGGPGTGKTMLRALGFELGIVESYEVRPCPCGNAWHLYAACHCTPEMIRRHAADWPATQIQVQTEYLKPRELESRSVGMTIGEMRRQIAEIGPPLKSRTRSEDVQYLFKAAVAELALDGWQVATTWSVAQTIARLDHAAEVKPAHLCEAINYRSLLAGVWRTARDKQRDAEAA